MDIKDYWIECVQYACEEVGLVATQAQIQSIAEAVKTSHENIGLAFGYAENPLISENSRLKAELEKERRKITCPECKGRGYITTVFNSCGRTVTSQCSKCSGEGKIIK